MVPKAHVVSMSNDSSNEFSNISKSGKKTQKQIKDLYETTAFFSSSDFTTNYLTDSAGASDDNIYLQIEPNQGSNFLREKKSKTSLDNITTGTTIEMSQQQSSCSDNDDDTNDSSNDDHKRLLLPSASLNEKHSNGFLANSAKTPKNEKAKHICIQAMFPFVMAGLGMVAVGIVLDKVQHWEVFQKIPEIFILVPALLGLKGNLEMTLASRLSTYANRGYLDDSTKRWEIVWGNMVVVEAQAMVVAFLASFAAMVLGWIPDGKWENEHALMLCSGSLLTAAIASGLLGLFMILVVLLSKRCGINPDNVATPIAAALGDLITLLLLSAIVKGLYSILHKTAWVGYAIVAVFVVLTILFLYFSHRNPYTNDVIKNGWLPVIAAMGISSIGGLILDFAVLINPGVAVFVPIINGVGGNLAAVQASRISTHLHSSEAPLGELPEGEHSGCLTPCTTFCSSKNVHSVGARVLLFMVLPGQMAFVLIIQYVQAGHTTITPQFVAVYLLIAFIQVAILLQICNWLVIRLWRSRVDPDNSAIPYITSLGDLLGTGLLVLGFYCLWLVGDRDSDVGD